MDGAEEGADTPVTVQPVRVSIRTSADRAEVPCRGNWRQPRARNGRSGNGIGTAGGRWTKGVEDEQPLGRWQWATAQDSRWAGPALRLDGGAVQVERLKQRVEALDVPGAGAEASVMRLVGAAEAEVVGHDDPVPGGERACEVAVGGTSRGRSTA